MFREDGLLLKLAQTSSIFIHQQVNLALDASVEGCSTGGVMQHRTEVRGDN